MQQSQDIIEHIFIIIHVFLMFLLSQDSDLCVKPKMLAGLVQLWNQSYVLVSHCSHSNTTYLRTTISVLCASELLKKPLLGHTIHASYTLSLIVSVPNIQGKISN